MLKVLFQIRLHHHHRIIKWSIFCVIVAAVVAVAASLHFANIRLRY